MLTLNFIAHPDDDLLFMNPDIAEELERGDRVCVMYMTQGDDGRDGKYAINRWVAARSAYETFGNVWGKQVRRTTAPIKSNCFRIGDIYGDLYKMWHDESYVATLTTDFYFQFGEDTYKRDRASLIRNIQYEIETSKPDLIRIHNPDAEPAVDHDEPNLDHIDHIYSAKFVVEAAKGFNIPIWAYEGYPIRHYPANITDPHQIELKTKMWRAYQSVDTEVAGEQWDVALTRQYKRQLQ